MVTQQAILDLAERIGRRFAPQRVILFGSHAYGTPRDESDVDLLIVMPFDGTAGEASMAIWRQTRPGFPVDLLVRRPEEVARQYREWDPLVREALDKGKVLYERDGAPVAAKG